MGVGTGSGELREKSNLLLVVEDDDEMRELLRVELESEGFSILTAINGAQGVSTARSRKPDVILMDIQMPEMNGIEATKILKEDKDTQHIPVIMVTSIETKEDMVKGLEVGAIDYITKPFFLPELKARVGAVLRFVNLYNDLIKLKEQLIKQDMLETIRELTWLVKGAVNDHFEIILEKFDNLRQQQKHISDDDLYLIKDASYNIMSTVVNLNTLDSFTLKIYETISDIVDRAH